MTSSIPDKAKVKGKGYVENESLVFRLVSAYVNPFDYPLWELCLNTTRQFPKPQNTDGPKKTLQLIWNQLPLDPINKATLSFTDDVELLCERWDGQLEGALR